MSTPEEKTLEAMRPMYAFITSEHKRHLFDRTVSDLLGALREAVEAEREACAMVAGDMRLGFLDSRPTADRAAAAIARAIRARGKP